MKTKEVVNKINILCEKSYHKKFLIEILEKINL